MSLFRRILAAVVLALLGAMPARAAETPVVAVAASLRFAVEEIATQYEKSSGKSVKLSFGATGNLVRQIEEGAPFELFFSADTAGPKKLALAGLTDGEPVLIVRGRLALAAPKGGAVKVDDKLDGLKAAFKSGAIIKFSIANPELAPYGKAAKAALEKQGLWADAADKIVLGENVAQAAQFVASGAAQAGLVAYSLTVSKEFNEALDSAPVPEDWHQPLDQAGAVLKTAGPEAKAFFTFLRGPDGKAVFEKNGFAVP